VTILITDEHGDNNISVGNGNKDIVIEEGNLAFQSGVNADLNFGDLIIEAGGELTVSDNLVNFQGNYDNQGGSVAGNNGTFRMDGAGNRTYTSHTIDEFYNFDIRLSNNQNLTITSGDTVQANGTLFLTNGQANTGALQSAGDVDIATGFDGGNAPLIFTGSNAQALTTNGSAGTFNGDVVVAKTITGPITLNSDFTLDANNQELILSKGWIVTTDANLLTLGDNITATGGNDSSFVSGPLQKIGNEAFTFPVGKDSVYAEIAMSAPTGTGHAFQAEYFNESADPSFDLDLKENTINHISVCEYWVLDRVAGSSNVTVTLSWDDPRTCGVGDLAELLVVRWDATDMEWKNEGNGGTTGNTTAGTIATSGAITTFSPFTLASVTLDNPLPIELLSFDASLVAQQVELSWTTLTETNNDYFIVQKSADTQNWQDIAEVDGAGNSQQIRNYQFIDEEVLTGISYYRIKQVDFDGTSSYSRTRSVWYQPLSEIDVLLYPNPSQHQLVNIRAAAATPIQQVLGYDALGRQIDLKYESKESNHFILRTQNLASGVYWLKILLEDGKVIYKRMLIE